MERFYFILCLFCKQAPKVEPPEKSEVFQRARRNSFSTHPPKGLIQKDPISERNVGFPQQMEASVYIIPPEINLDRLSTEEIRQLLGIPPPVLTYPHIHIHFQQFFDLQFYKSIC